MTVTLLNVYSCNYPCFILHPAQIEVCIAIRSCFPHGNEDILIGGVHPSVIVPHLLDTGAYTNIWILRLREQIRHVFQIETKEALLATKIFSFRSHMTRKQLLNHAQEETSAFSAVEWRLLRTAAIAMFHVVSVHMCQNVTAVVIVMMPALLLINCIVKGVTRANHPNNCPQHHGRIPVPSHVGLDALHNCTVLVRILSVHVVYYRAPTTLQ
mmetsp:Transcript_22936/g.39199  ORF Transcript_22936/g.39199 Transcript_22936/m.39199 type:complete len:212 (-) Transcript_22936:309-944(-)